MQIVSKMKNVSICRLLKILPRVLSFKDLEDCLPGKVCVRLTDQLNMTLTVLTQGRKTQTTK